MLSTSAQRHVLAVRRRCNLVCWDCHFFQVEAWPLRLHFLQLHSPGSFPLPCIDACAHVFSCHVLLCTHVRAQNRTIGCLSRARLPDSAGRCCHFQILAGGTFFNIVLYDDVFGKRGSLWKEVVMDALQMLLSLLCLGYGVWALIPVKYQILGSSQNSEA